MTFTFKVDENGDFHRVRNEGLMDREKVIKGLECHRIDNNHRINCADCPYYVDDNKYIRCVNDLHTDTLELLKEQEAVIIEWKNGFPHCPVCGQMLPEGDAVKFCLHCGRSVKWE